jgi:hypothetical protein
VSDARLREVERRWKTSGTVEDEAAYLVQCLRSGDLAAPLLGLAAWLEHPAALAALRSPLLDPDLFRDAGFLKANKRFGSSPGDALIIDLDPRGSMAARTQRLAEWGALRRAAIAAIRCEIAAGGDFSERARTALVAVEDWEVAPSAETRSAVADCLPPDPDRPFFIPDAPNWAVSLLHSVCPPPGMGVARAVGAVRSCASTHPGGELPVWKAICAELLPWALQRGDPLYERVLARRPELRPVVVIRDPQSGRRLFAAAGTTVICGRHSDSTLQCRDDHVSRRHCELQPQADGSVVVLDLSRSGTSVDGQDVSTSQRISPGARLLLGGAYELRIEAVPASDMDG